MVYVRARVPSLQLCLPCISAKEEGVMTAVIGGEQLISQQYTGAVGGQSFSFTVIDSEIKSTKHK
jgi:hypothetical protein